jgi:hypothetical protein
MVASPTVDFSAEAIVTIGRDLDCNIVLNDPLSSRRHARIATFRNSVVLEDIKSANGVYLNGTRVDEPFPLHAGDRIIIRTSEFPCFRPEARDRDRGCGSTKESAGPLACRPARVQRASQCCWLSPVHQCAHRNPLVDLRVVQEELELVRQDALNTTAKRKLHEFLYRKRLGSIRARHQHAIER